MKYTLEELKQIRIKIAGFDPNDEEECLKRINDCDPYILIHVKEQTKDICLEAVKRDGYALQYVKDLSMMVDDNCTENNSKIKAITVTMGDTIDIESNSDVIDLSMLQSDIIELAKELGSPYANDIIRVVYIQNNSGFKDEYDRVKKIVEKYDDDNTIICISAYASYDEFPQSEFYLYDRDYEKGKTKLPLDYVLNREFNTLARCGFSDFNFYTNYENSIAMIYTNNNIGMDIISLAEKYSNDKSFISIHQNSVNPVIMPNPNTINSVLYSMNMCLKDSVILYKKYYGDVLATTILADIHKQPKENRIVLVDVDFEDIIKENHSGEFIKLNFDNTDTYIYMYIDECSTILLPTLIKNTFPQKDNFIAIKLDGSEKNPKIELPIFKTIRKIKYALDQQHKNISVAYVINYYDDVYINKVSDDVKYLNAEDDSIVLANIYPYVSPINANVDNNIVRDKAYDISLDTDYYIIDSQYSIDKNVPTLMLRRNECGRSIIDDMLDYCADIREETNKSMHEKFSNIKCIDQYTAEIDAFGRIIIRVFTKFNIILTKALFDCDLNNGSMNLTTYETNNITYYYNDCKFRNIVEKINYTVNQIGKIVRDMYETGIQNRDAKSDIEKFREICPTPELLEKFLRSHTFIDITEK